MYQDFTERARKVMQLANSAALELGARVEINSGHVLLGLLEEGVGVAANVLKNLGVTYTQLRALVIKLSPVSSKTSAGFGQLLFNLEVETMVRTAPEEVKKLQHMFVGTEHLLLALMRNPSPWTGKILTEFGITAAHVISTTMELLGFEDPEEIVGITIPLTPAETEALEKLRELHGHATLEDTVREALKLYGVEA